MTVDVVFLTTARLMVVPHPQTDVEARVHAGA